MLSDDAKAVIALTTRLGDSRRPSLPPTEWHRLATALGDAGLRPRDIFEADTEIESIPGISGDLAAKIGELLRDASVATVEAAELSNIGIWTLTIVDDDYPATLIDRLGRNTPPVIFGAGDASLLDGTGVGIVGSRNVGEAGAQVAKEIATAAAGLGRSVVSGGARGVDQLAMNSAYQADGGVVGVLADSLEKRIQKPDVLAALDRGQNCLLTQQAPSSGFTPAAAMSRNKLIYALSAVTIVVATDEDTGGTWAGATEALKKHIAAIAVWRGNGEGPGNEALERAGATPIRSADALRDLLEAEPASEPEQLAITELGV
ncbi:MAG: DNA-processing protein DprA [Acidimicrobiia bacterium]|nr:MAG: DNA-processing protein DprA [Acidimicrobiia bacterium]